MINCYFVAKDFKNLFIYLFYELPDKSGMIVLKNKYYACMHA